MHRQLLLSDEVPAQGFLEAPALKAMAPIGSDPIQAYRSQAGSTHSADCNTDQSLVYCNIRLQPKSSIALRNRGTPVLMSARCHNQTSCHNLRSLLRESSVPHSPKTLPQRSGTFSETPITPCTARPSLPSGKLPQRLAIGLTPSRP